MSLLHTILPIFFVLSSLATNAADLFVREFGVSPDFNSIQTAIDSAAPGDRIFVQNKAGNAPYLEDVTINKPIELLSFAPNDLFHVQGFYSIDAPLNNHEFGLGKWTVTIVGMRNLAGNIEGLTNSADTVINLHVFSCQIDSGDIGDGGNDELFAYEIAGNQLLDGTIHCRNGNVVGNDVHGVIWSTTGSSVSGDTLYIVGNRVWGTPATSYIAWDSESAYCYIANNFVTTTLGLYGHIYLRKLASGRGTNTVINNSIVSGHNSGITVSDSIFHRLNVFNNAFHHIGVYINTALITITGNLRPEALVEIGYNVYEGAQNGAANAPETVYVHNNVEASPNFQLDPVTGRCLEPECVDLGHPSWLYYDHDFTRNDVGTAGGSFHFSNYYPLFTGAARTYLVRTPRVAAVSGGMKAAASGYDR